MFFYYGFVLYISRFPDAASFQLKPFVTAGRKSFLSVPSGQWLMVQKSSPGLAGFAFRFMIGSAIAVTVARSALRGIPFDIACFPAAVFSLVNVFTLFAHVLLFTSFWLDDAFFIIIVRKFSDFTPRSDGFPDGDKAGSLFVYFPVFPIPPSSLKSVVKNLC